MDDRTQRSILEALAAHKLTLEEAEQALAQADLNDQTSEPPAAAVSAAPPVETRWTGLSESEWAAGSRAEPRPTVPLTGQSWPAVRAKLSARGAIAVLGEPGAAEPRFDGPHSASIRATEPGVFSVAGDVGPDALLIVPSDADLTLEANGQSCVVRGVTGTLTGLFNVSEATVQGRLDRGYSKIVANLGLLTVLLDPESSVRMRICCATDSRPGEGLVPSGRGEWMVGAGDSQLDIDGTPGAVRMDVDRHG
jgi:hypothetical protein